MWGGGGGGIMARSMTTMLAMAAPAVRVRVASDVNTIKLGVYGGQITSFILNKRKRWVLQELDMYSMCLVA